MIWLISMFGMWGDCFTIVAKLECSHHVFYRARVMDLKLADDLLKIKKLMEDRLNVSGDFSEMVMRARRFVPAKILRRMKNLEAAQSFIDHPKLRVTVNQDTCAQDARVVMQYLQQLDLADRRKGRRLDIAATLFFALLMALGGLVFVLRWRGFI